MCLDSLGSFGFLTLANKHAHGYVWNAESANGAIVPVFNLDNEEVGQYTLPQSIFGVDVRKDILHRVVRWQLAKRQQVSKSAIASIISGLALYVARPYADDKEPNPHRSYFCWFLLYGSSCELPLLTEASVMNSIDFHFFSYLAHMPSMKPALFVSCMGRVC